MSDSLYKSGVFNENSNADINHAVTLVGWDDSKQAWRIKNSWGKAWEEAGYMWIAYNANKIGYGTSWVQAKLNPPEPTCEDGPSLIAYNELYWSDNKQFSSNDNVLSVTFTLPKARYVSIVADGSTFFAKGAAPKDFTTGLYSDPTPGTIWTASYRKGSFQVINQHVPVHSSFAMKLPAGTYTYLEDLGQWLHHRRDNMQPEIPGWRCQRRVLCRRLWSHRKTWGA